MHTPEHRQQLSDAAAVGAPGSDDRIRAVDLVIERMRAENPGAFHTAESLGDRTFWHAPKHDLPMRGFVTAVIVG